MCIRDRHYSGRGCEEPSLAVKRTTQPSRGSPGRSRNGATLACETLARSPETQGRHLPVAALWPPPPRESYYDGRPNAAVMPCGTSQAQAAAEIKLRGCPRALCIGSTEIRSQKQAAQHRAALDIDATCAPRRPRIQATSREHAGRTTRRFPPEQHIRSADASRRRRRARGPSPSPHRTSRPQSEITRE